MNTIRRVVVAYDGSPSSEAALRAGTETAREHDVPLLLVTAVDVDQATPPPFADLPRATSEVVATAMGTVAAVLGGDDRVSSRVAVGPAAAVVLGTLTEGDLVVLGGHSRSLIGRALIGSTSRTVATHADVPVLVVRPGAEPGAAGHVVVGVDGSALSTSATRFAATQAARRGVPLRAVMAVPERVDSHGEVSGPDDPALQAAAVTLAEAVAGLRQDNPDLQVEQMVVQGSASDVLLHQAYGASLLVVGSRGLGALRSMVFGSVGRHVLDRATSSVAVVR